MSDDEKLELPTGKNNEGHSQQLAYIVLFKHLIRQMAADKDMDTTQLADIKMEEFVVWCREHIEWVSNSEMLATLGLTLKDTNGAWKLCGQPFQAAAVLTPIWPMLTLQAQPPIKHVPTFMDVAITFGFDIGDPTAARALQIRMPNKFLPDKPLTNGFLAALLRNQTNQAIRTLEKSGLDELYAQYAKPIGDTAPKPVPVTSG